MQRKCYNEYWQNTDCSGERSFHSIFRYDMSSCISGMEIYGDNDQWWYTPTSRCRDSGCMDCEDFTSMPSRKHQCMPCSFRDNCSFMRVDCEYDGNHHFQNFTKDVTRARHRARVRFLIRAHSVCSMLKRVQKVGRARAACLARARRSSLILTFEIQI